MDRWRAAPGCHFALFEQGWVGYSGLSGETHLLNEESVAIVDVLSGSGGSTIAEVCAELSQTFSMTVAELEALLVPSWNSLVAAGLLQKTSGSVSS